VVATAVVAAVADVATAAEANGAAANLARVRARPFRARTDLAGNFTQTVRGLAFHNSLGGVPDPALQM
jgi:hypothetical protein